MPQTSKNTVDQAGQLLAANRLQDVDHGESFPRDNVALAESLAPLARYAQGDHEMTQNAKANEARALAYIAGCDDPAKLKSTITNARRQQNEAVTQAASLRLYEVMPSALSGTLEHDVWRSVYALEDALKSERGKTILLGRTRQKIARDGELKTVADLVLGNTSDGFLMLIDRGMTDHTFEAVALRHPAFFAAEVLEAARARLC